MQKNKNNRGDQSSNSSEVSVSSNEVEIPQPKKNLQPNSSEVASYKHMRNEHSQIIDAFNENIERKDDGDTGIKKEEEKEKSTSSDDGKVKSCKFKIYIVINMPLMSHDN